MVFDFRQTLDRLYKYSEPSFDLMLCLTCHIQNQELDLHAIFEPRVPRLNGFLILIDVTSEWLLLFYQLHKMGLSDIS